MILFAILTFNVSYVVYVDNYIANGFIFWISKIFFSLKWIIITNADGNLK